MDGKTLREEWGEVAADFFLTVASKFVLACEEMEEAGKVETDLSALGVRIGWGPDMREKDLETVGALARVCLRVVAGGGNVREVTVESVRAEVVAGRVWAKDVEAAAAEMEAAGVTTH